MFWIKIPSSKIYLCLCHVGKKRSITSEYFAELREKPAAIAVWVQKPAMVCSMAALRNRSSTFVPTGPSVALLAVCQMSTCLLVPVSHCYCW